MTTGRVLITGAGGFVGCHLAEGFRRLGYTVTAIDRGFDDASSERLRECQRVVGDVSSAVLGALGASFDLVVHAAAITSSPAAMGITDAAHIRANLDPLLDVIDFAQRAGVATFVFVSSSGVFAAGDADGLLLESTVPTSRSAYAVAKRTGEEIVAAAATKALLALSVRLGYIYGLDERSRATRLDVSLVRRWADCVARSEPIVVRTPDALRDWTFAGDLAAAIDAVLRTGPTVPLIHLGSGEIVTDLELARAVTAAAGRGEVVVDPAPGAPKSKAPMGSLHGLDVRWTALRDALTSIVAESVAA